MEEKEDWLLDFVATTLVRLYLVAALIFAVCFVDTYVYMWDADDVNEQEVAQWVGLIYEVTDCSRISMPNNISFLPEDEFEQAYVEGSEKHADRLEQYREKGISLAGFYRFRNKNLFVNSDTFYVRQIYVHEFIHHVTFELYLNSKQFREKYRQEILFNEDMVDLLTNEYFAKKRFSCWFLYHVGFFYLIDGN